jgi:TRAP-type C4-dicarboxylate transport system permease small subunit
MYDLLEKAADRLARGTALLGGVVLLAVVLMTCVSITGRALVPLGLGPVHGDFEWIEMGVGFAIFAFLPWCQLQRGHASVDLFRPVFPSGMNRVIDLLVDVAMFLAAFVIAWRLWLGLLDKQRYGETTFIIQFPIWIAYAACLLGAVATVIIAAFCIIRSGRALVTSRQS